MPMDTQGWEDHIIRAVRGQPDLQSWASHLGVRLPEIRDLAARALEIADLGPRHAADAPRFDTLLEIGCGNALGSAYFSPLARTIVATDLDAPDQRGPASHAIGLGRARALIAAVGARNVEVRSASAEDLPFADSSFDAILAMHTLEHVPRLERGLAECLRVLRPGGHLIASVPATCWSIAFPLSFYHELGSRVLDRFVLKRWRSRNSARETDVDGAPAASAVSDAAQPVVRDWASFRKAYPQFPLPSPHGESTSWLTEVFDLRPSRWRRLVTDAGFDPVEARAMSVLPRALLRVALGSLEPRLYERLEGLDRAASRGDGAVPFAQVLALVARKPLD